MTCNFCAKSGTRTNLQTYIEGTPSGITVYKNKTTVTYNYKAYIVRISTRCFQLMEFQNKSQNFFQWWSC